MRAGFAAISMVAVALLLPFLSGCAGLRDIPDEPIALSDTVKLGPPLERFTATGRLALRQGERRDHLRFRWTHSPVSDRVLLMSPLGQGMAELNRDAFGARLLRGNQAPVEAASLRQLTAQLFNIELPLERLADWMRGAEPDLTGEVEGWRVRVSEVTRYPPDDDVSVRRHQLLRVMDVTQTGIEMRLVVDVWESSDEAPNDASTVAPTDAAGERALPP